jgi:hypothetical protein
MNGNRIHDIKKDLARVTTTNLALRDYKHEAQVFGSPPKNITRQAGSLSYEKAWRVSSTNERQAM